MRRLADRANQSTIETLLKTASREKKKGILSSISGAVEDIVKPAVNRILSDNALCSKPDRLTESLEFAQCIGDFIMGRQQLQLQSLN